MLRRRLRGILASIAGGALFGALGGMAIALLFLLVPGGTLTISPRFPGAAFIVPTVWFAAIGALSGGVFGTLLMLAERGHRVAELRPYRMAIWAAVPTALALRFFGGASWTLVALGTGVAAGIGAAATVLAKRGGEPAMTGFDSDADERRAP